MRQTISLHELKCLLQYSKSTGLFTWKKSRPRCRAGAVAGSMTPDGYIAICVKGKVYQAHRLAWFYSYGTWPAQGIDHKNRVKNDNRLRNLRDISQAANCQNTIAPRKHNKLGIVGVSKVGNRYQTQIGFQGQKIKLGTYPTPEAAHAVYMEAKRRLHPLTFSDTLDVRVSPY